MRGGVWQQQHFPRVVRPFERYLTLAFFCRKGVTVPLNHKPPLLLSLSLSPALCMSPFLSFSLIELLFLENIVEHPRRTAAPLSSTSRWHLAVTLEAAPCLSSLFATTTTTTADTFHNHSVCQPKQQQRHQHKTATQKYHLFHLLITLLIAQHSLT